jgi:hypothetical protein
MNDKLNKEFVEGIRQGSLVAVVRALEAGADLECVDQYGFRGLALRTACFIGQKDIVLELLRRGANADAANSDGPGAPGRMATRGKRDEIIAILRTYTTVPPSVLAATAAPEIPPSTLSPPRPNTPPKTAPAPIELELHDIETLDITACYGVDTNVLEGDLLRLSQSDIGVGGGPENDKKSAVNEEKPVRRKFW